MEKIFAKKLKKNDSIRVISPSRSLAIIRGTKIADLRFKKLKLKVTISKNAHKINVFQSSSIQERINDFHDAIRDPNIKMVISAIGGYNANELLLYLDYELIRRNPKLIGGFSDITVLLNAIYAKTGLVTYHSPHYSSFGEKKGFIYTQKYFQECLFENNKIIINDSTYWSNDTWWLDQEKRIFIKNTGRIIVNEGVAKGTILGGHLSTFQLLFGTEYLPDLNNSVLFLEFGTDNDEGSIYRILESMSQQKMFRGVKGILFGRFSSKVMNKENLIHFLKTHKLFKRIPIIIDLDFGHLEPFFTFPIGGTVEFNAHDGKSKITILKH